MLIKELSEIPGVSGDESRVRAFIRQELDKMGVLSATDSIGNLYAFKGDSKWQEGSVMLTAHMDEVGMMIASIEKSGHLKVYPVGGLDELLLLSKSVRIGPDNIPGVIGAKAVHLQKKEEREKAVEIDKLYIDIGARDKEDAEKSVKVGDYISFLSEGRLQQGDLFSGKALDNRAGCAALLEILKKDYPFSITGVFSVQEEVGLRGAKVAAYRINPRIALVIETTTAADLPDIKEHEHATSLGKGPAFTIRDDSVITHPLILERLLSVAEKEGIPFQFRRFTGSFTDAGAISLSRSGVMSGVISTPCRYLHSPASLINLHDWRNLVQVVDGFLNSIGEKGF